MVPSNDPEEMPVAVFSNRTPLKLPVAPSNRPVPPTMLEVPWIESSLGTPVGVACPLPVLKRRSPFAATKIAFPSAVPTPVVRSIRALDTAERSVLDLQEKLLIEHADHR